MNLGSRKVYIHNIYLAPRPYSSLEVLEALARLQELLDLKGEYITLGDFNLHHPLWNPGRNGHHLLADSLLDLLGNRGLELLLPKGTITRDVLKGRNHERSTLDLIFSTISSLEGCVIDWDLE